MKKFAILLVVPFFFVSGQSDYWSNFQKSFENFGENLSRNLQAQGKRIQENAKQFATQVQNEQRINTEKLQTSRNEILETVEKIEAGNPPTGINSNTTSLSANVNGKVLTIKNTIFSTGNDQEGAIHNVQSVYEESTRKDWSVNTISWNGNQIRKHYVNNGGTVVTSGGNIFIN